MDGERGWLRPVVPVGDLLPTRTQASSQMRRNGDVRDRDVGLVEPVVEVQTVAGVKYLLHCIEMKRLGVDHGAEQGRDVGQEHRPAGVRAETGERNGAGRVDD